MSKNKLLALILAFGMITYQTACTSGEVEDGTEEQFNEDGASDFADEGATGDAPADKAKSDKVAEENFDDLPAETTDAAQDKPAGDELALDEGAAKEQSTAAGGDELSLEDVPDDVASAPAAKDAAVPTDDALFNDQAAAPAPAPAPDTMPPPVEEPTSTADNAPPPAPEPAPAVYMPLLKIKDAAFNAPDGTLLNRVYLGRAGDTSKSVAQKIYGDKARAKDLKAWNILLKKREVKVGDKIYYSSPNNPTDDSMRTYYEDMNIAPQIYTTQGEGENLRKLSKEFLGHKESWKEVWATNRDIESKGNLPPGTQIKYWPESAVAKAPEPPPAPVEPPQPPPVAENPPPADGLPPLPDDPSHKSPDTAAAPVVEPPPPPPPPPPVEPPPPAPKPVASITEFQDDDSVMMAALAGLLLLAGALTFVVLRRNRSKKLDLGQTQI